MFGFLGPNGAGKTTAVKLLLGLARPTGGGGTVLGRPLGDRETRRRIGYLPELFRYQAWLTAREVLELHASLAGLPGATRGAEIDRVLDLVGLAGRDRDRTGGFSKGMQQRLGLATALLGDPDLVILDEPTSALDPVGRDDVRAIIREARDRGLDGAPQLPPPRRGRAAVRPGRDRQPRAGRRGRQPRRPPRRDVASGSGSPDLPRPGAGASAPSARSPPTATGSRSAASTPTASRTSSRPLVAAGGRIHAVDPGRRSLEDLFLDLVRDEAAATTEAPAA